MTRSDVLSLRSLGVLAAPPPRRRTPARPGVSPPPEDALRPTTNARASARAERDAQQFQHGRLASQPDCGVPARPGDKSKSSKQGAEMS